MWKEKIEQELNIPTLRLALRYHIEAGNAIDAADIMFLLSKLQFG